MLLADLRSPDLDTRFLGDLYQDLSDLAKKKYALLQTPVFVEEFILDRTLTPALREFGLPGLRLIDPTCGSGHFLLGAFDRLFAAWQQKEPAASTSEHARRALGSVYGVDLNPFAAAIARFRLAVAALRATGFTRLADAPAFPINVAVGDSLLGGVEQGALFDGTGAATFHYRDEDIAEHPGILQPGRYHVVVGNPPYITVKDKALNEAYRVAYPTCKGKYALSVPFMELFFRLAVRGAPDQPAGFVGQITSNSFMKREFGSKVIESLLSGTDVSNPVDLLDVIDTSGAYIPGHGTPTVILVGRRRRPVAPTVRAVLGVRGEPGQPDDPAKGLVWTEIVEHIDAPGFDGPYVTVTDLDRDALKTHPWSPQRRRRQATLRTSTGCGRRERLRIESTQIGFFGDHGRRRARTMRLPAPSSSGELEHRFPGARCGRARPRLRCRVDLTGSGSRTTTAHPVDVWMRRPLGHACSGRIEPSWATRATFSGGTYCSDAASVVRVAPAAGRRAIPHAVVDRFAEVATHNHFVLDRGGKAFNRTAPVIKLPAGASEDDHLALLGVLNSSAACFWLKQVSHDKGNGRLWRRHRRSGVGAVLRVQRARRCRSSRCPRRCRWSGGGGWTPSPRNLPRRRPRPCVRREPRPVPRSTPLAPSTSASAGR